MESPASVALCKALGPRIVRSVMKLEVAIVTQTRDPRFAPFPHLKRAIDVTDPNPPVS